MTTPGYRPFFSRGVPGGGIQTFPRSVAPSEDVNDTGSTVPPVSWRQSSTVRNESAACEPGTSVVKPPWM